GMGPDADPAVVDDLVLGSLVGAAVADEASPVHGREPAEVIAELGDRRGPERLLDLMLRTGPYRLTLDQLLEHPHGLDLGPLEPRLPDVLRTPSGMVELAPEVLLQDVADRMLPRLSAAAAGVGTNGGNAAGPNGLRLIGRRDLRSNNSWMHNVEVLVKGRPRCTLHVHPSDAERLGLADGADAKVASSAGTVTIPVEVTDGIREGVVSIPHGWGHDAPGVRLSVATRYAGVNTNVLSPSTLLDPVSGTSVLNGIPVTVTPA
ncbi:MAG TPA: molybdopterin dinucleotide binding domain-containing protein, partial [Acidimicrobiales bacterium]